RTGASGLPRSADIARAIEVEGGAGRVARQPGSEESDRVRDVLRLGDFTERDRVRRRLDTVLVAEGGGETGAHAAPRHGAGGDVVLAEMPRDRSRHRHDAALRGRVMHEIRIVATKSRPARQVDDDAAALRLEVVDRLAAEMSDGDQVHLQGAMPGGAPG